MATYYKLSEPAILEYYNMVGVDLKKIDFRYIETESRYLEELSPINNGHDYIPCSSIEIDSEMQTFLYKMCEFGYSEEAQSIQNNYHQAYIGIINAATSLNLIPDDSTDYELHFKRLNTVLLTVMRELNFLDIFDVIAIFNLIQNKDIKGILSINGCPFTKCLVILAMNPNADLADYNMFSSEDSSLISETNLINLVTANLWIKSDYVPLTVWPGRVGYLGSQLR